MATIVYLIRHATHELIGRRLVGRTSGVGLSALGVQQALILGVRLSHERIMCVQSSPQRRARETAEVIASALALPIDIVPQMDELDFGSWTGWTFDELERDRHWHQWNWNRASVRAPGGESMAELQARVLDHLATLQRQDPDGEIVVVSHAEPIRAAVLHYRRLSFDDFASVPIEPASITVLSLHSQGGEILEEQNALPDLVAI